MKKQTKIGFFSLIFFFSFLGITFGESTLLTTMKTQKTVIENLYDTSYQTVYNQFQTSALSVIKSLNYQSLVCLGVMDGDLFLQQMQSDMKTLKMEFLTTYNRIYTDLVDIEQKYTLEKDTSVVLFASGSSYTSEYAKLSGEFMILITENKQLAQNFQSSYQSKIATFIQDVDDYTTKNQTLVTAISAKIQKIQSLTSDFQQITDKLSTFRENLAGTGKAFFTQIQKIKSASLSGLDTSMQNLANVKVKRYRILKTLSGELSTQKDYAIGLFAMQFDEKLNLFLSQWYDNKEYLSLKNQLDIFYKKYFSSNTYQCTTLLTSTGFDTDALSLQQKITNFGTTLSFSGVTTSNIDFQNKVLAWFTTVSSGQKEMLKTFTTAMNQKISSLLAIYRGEVSSLSSTVSSEQSSSTQTSSFTVTNFTFTRPFTTNQKHSDIKILQQLLTSIGFYTGEVNGMYDKQTKNAVYQFQLANGILKGYENKPQTWGWMGPATRAKLNQLLKG